MRDERFEWDERKAARNVAKHAVDFLDATLVFADMQAIENFDDSDDDGEDRWLRTGWANGIVLVVSYCDRGSRKRIISARKATRHEQDEYFKR
jgi:uncharacterized protein